MALELLKKLQVKPGARLRLINVPKHIHHELTKEGGIKPVKTAGPCDGAIAFCDHPDHVQEFAQEHLARMPHDGLLWFAYRKGVAAKASGLSRDVGWQAVRDAGWRPVRSIAFDEDWTGLRFRPQDAVKSQNRG